MTTFTHVPGLIPGSDKPIPGFRAIRAIADAAMEPGDVVVLVTTAAKNTPGNLPHVNKTTSADSTLVCGVVADGQPAIVAGQEVFVQVAGLHENVKVDGTTDLANGDPLATFTTGGVAAKGTADASAFGIYVDAGHTTDATTVQHKALLTNPRGLWQTSGSAC